MRLARYRSAQAALTRRYGLDGVAPRSYDDAVRGRVVAAAAKCEEPSSFAWTSGTTASPKQIHYPRSRLRRLQRTYIEQAVLAWAHHRCKSPALCFPASLGDVRSLTGLLASVKVPETLRLLALPRSPLPGRRLAALAESCSPRAFHTLVMAVSAPALIAMPNPSTLFVLLERLGAEWGQLREEWESALAKPELGALARTLGAHAQDRLALAREWAGNGSPPPLREFLPRLRVVSCWTGGYVQPFLQRLDALLAGLRVVVHPMFSISTETVETEVYPSRSLQGGLPVHPGVRYEFGEAGAAAHEPCLLDPWDLIEGKSYVMVVSDGYGLCRYDTQDRFSCRGFVGPAPILRFEGREGVGYSFTGEKITAAQVLEVFGHLRSGAGISASALVCFPLKNPGGTPGYLLVACQEPADSPPPPDWLGDAFDDRLGRVNEEYAAKRASGRLSRPRVEAMAYGDMVAILERRWSAPDAHPGQFKLLPLYPSPWEEIANG